MSSTTEIDRSNQIVLKSGTVFDQTSAKRLAGKKAVITGGSTGMGLATATR